MNYAANLDRDGNRQIVPGGLPFCARKQRVYTGASGLGAAGTTTLFTVTGQVLLRVIGFCYEDLVGAATLEVGIAGNTAGLLAQIADATNLDAGESYLDATPGTLEAVDLSSGFPISNGQDVIETIGATDITDGSVLFGCFWRPVSSDGAVVAT